jgi:hypothetical protein
MWQKCSVCKKPISDSCWDAHDPDQNLRNPSYTEHRAPAAPPAS